MTPEEENRQLRRELEQLRLNTLAQGFLLEPSFGDAGPKTGKAIRELTRRLRNQKNELSNLRVAQERMRNLLADQVRLFYQISQLDPHYFGAQDRLCKAIDLAESGVAAARAHQHRRD